jgi:DNA-binding ferritin-like protein
MFEKLISTLMASRDQAHVFHWQTTGVGSFAMHTALNAYYDAIPGLLDVLVESYQGKHGIVNGYTPAEQFDEFNNGNVLKYFKGLAMYVERAYDKLDAKDTYILNQIDNVKELIYSTIYKLENLQ